MFDSLLESRPRKSSRLGGSLVATTAHVALIAGIVAVTANAGVAREAPEQHEVIYTAPPPPPPPPPVPVANRIVAPPVAQGFTVLTAPIEIPDVIPPIDLTKLPTDDRAWSGIGKPGGSPDGIAIGGAATAVGNPNDVFTRETVDRYVVILPGSPGPAYPELLRTAGVEGDVMAQFVVDTTGRADVSTLRILQSDHQLFSDAVKSVISRLRFRPAEVGGVKVRQLVQQPFRFGLDRD
jgi:periplasmic protein TonB